MSLGLLIAEKPSLERDIKAIYEKHKSQIPFDIVFACQRGHLFTLKLPNEINPAHKREWDCLPFFADEQGGWQYKIIDEKKKGNFLTSKERYNKIKSIIKNDKPDFIIHAGDPDREGQLLVDIVLNELQINIPVKRFWSNDLTDDAILDALLNLRGYNEPFMQNLLASAYCRQHTDYSYGLNTSSAASLKMNGKVATGRVRSVFLEIVRRREEEIANFVPSTCYGVKVNYENGLIGTLFNPKETEELIDSESSDVGIIWFENKSDADDLIASLSMKGEVISSTAKTVKTQPPKLYRLATAQIDGGKLGYSDKEVLDIIQSLYDKHYLSYPRTSCEYLSSHEDFRAYLDACNQVPSLQPFVSLINQSDIDRIKKNKRYVNDEKLKEAGHSALRPTADKVNFSSLSKNEQDIYEMICRQFVAIFLQPIIQEKTEIVTCIDGKYFRSVGKKLIDKGYAEIFDTKFSDSILCNVRKGDIIDVKNYDVSEKTTVCPRHLTSNDIIEICDNPAKYLMDSSLRMVAGKKLKIGTDATRSPIIESLIVRDKYLQKVEKGKKNAYLILTDLGKEIAENMKDCMICKVDMTGELETKLDLVAKGKLSAEEYETESKKSLITMINDIRNMPMKEITNAETSREFGQCPYCGKPIVAGTKSYFCSDYKNGCKFGLSAKICGADISVSDVNSLLNGNTVKKTFKKDGRSWSQDLRFTDDFKLEFVKEEREETEYLCPKCNRKLLSTSKGLYCPSVYEYYEKKKEQPDIDISNFCNFSLIQNICGKDIGRQNLLVLLETKKTPLIKGFISKKNKPFDAKLCLDDNFKMQFEFEERESQEGVASDFICPLCGKGLVQYPKVIKCDCGFTIWRVMAGKRLSDEVISDVLGYGCSKSVVYGFKSTKHKGKTFNARVALDRENKGFKFDFSN